MFLSETTKNKTKIFLTLMQCIVSKFAHSNSFIWKFTQSPTFVVRALKLLCFNNFFISTSFSKSRIESAKSWKHAMEFIVTPTYVVFMAIWENPPPANAAFSTKLMIINAMTFKSSIGMLWTRNSMQSMCVLYRCFYWQYLTIFRHHMGYHRDPEFA